LQPAFAHVQLIPSLLFLLYSIHRKHFCKMCTTVTPAPAPHADDAVEERKLPKSVSCSKTFRGNHALGDLQAVHTWMLELGELRGVEAGLALWQPACQVVETWTWQIGTWWLWRRSAPAEWASRLPQRWCAVAVCACGRWHYAQAALLRLPGAASA
jgi:hypothetical protein